jgi:hypothetical protein
MDAFTQTYGIAAIGTRKKAAAGTPLYNTYIIVAK